MTTFNKILVPVDFSSRSSRAMLLARLMSLQDPDAAFTVLHVWPPPVTYTPEPGLQVPVSSPGDYATQVEQEMMRMMQHLLRNFDLEGAPQFHPRIECGDPTRVIIQVAQVERFDLILLETHGRTGLSRLLLGSVAEKVVRRAGCPVLTIPPAGLEQMRHVGSEQPRAEETHPCARH